MKRIYVALIAIWIIALPYLAAQVVTRPSTPSATTLASPTSQIAAWYRYAVYLEGKLAAAKPEPSLQSISDKIDALAARPGISVSIQNSKVSLTATAEGTDPITFTWFKDGTQIGTGPTIAVQSGTAASYYVVAANLAGNAKSQTVVITAP